MLEIQNISDDTFQTQTIALEDGTTFRMELYFIPMQYMWIIRELTYLDFTLKNHRVCNNPNMLHQFKNILPFGLACESDEDREPTFIGDFQEGSSKLYVLTEDEVKQYGDFLSGN